MPKLRRIFETVLYAEDLEAAERFYRDVLGLDVIQRSDLFITFRCTYGVLLIFDPGKSRQPGRSVPAHGATGPGHVAFAIRPQELPTWREHLRGKGVEIEAEVEWKNGGVSLYFRDPADNSVELAPSSLWGGGWAF
jgi:catechol 2,3-dioxygenase-like lactoylglutathione lyase family enzyme